jgi:hypothetical protein
MEVQAFFVHNPSRINNVDLHKNPHIMIEKQNSSFSISTALISGLIGIVIGYFVLPLLLPSRECQAPPGLVQVPTNDGSIKVRWSDAKNDVVGYLVWAQDSLRLNADSVTSSITVIGTEATIPGLEPNKTYRISVFSICRKSDGTFSFSQKPTEMWAKTGYIVVEDLAHLDGLGAKNQCPFGTCDSLIMQNDSCFSWGNGAWNYQIEVFEKDANGNAGAQVLRTYLRKDAGNNTLKIGYAKDAVCNGAAQTLGDLPTPDKCTGGGCPANGNQLCGRLQTAAGPVCYGIKIDFTGCCINGLPKGKYIIRVKRCRETSIDS